MATKRETVASVDVNTMHPCMSYGLRHSKQYVPDPISQFLYEKDDDGNLIKKHSDIHLLLREKDLQKQIGTEVCRRYFESLQRSDSSIDTSSLTDDELFDLVPLKAVNNLTTSYEFSKYLEAHKKELKENYAAYKKRLEQQTEFERWFKPRNKSDDNFESKTE